jgi:acetyl/propionyl-CoA carboxylase alpha subunit
MVTGIDLVKAQIEIAAGLPLAIGQDDVVVRGHAIECRIVAEDPARDFAPAPGPIRAQRIPSGPGVRYDGGTYGGWTVPVFYDALIGKLVAWGRDRAEAIARMRRALDELRVDGLATSIGFQRRVMDHPAFVRGELSTAFLAEHPDLRRAADDPWLEEIAVVAAAVHHFRRAEAAPAACSAADRSRWKWNARRGWRS